MKELDIQHGNEHHERPKTPSFTASVVLGPSSGGLTNVRRKEPRPGSRSCKYSANGVPRCQHALSRVLIAKLVDIMMPLLTVVFRLAGSDQERKEYCFKLSTPRTGGNVYLPGPRTLLSLLEIRLLFLNYQTQWPWHAV